MFLPWLWCGPVADSSCETLLWDKAVSRKQGEFLVSGAVYCFAVCFAFHSVVILLFSQHLKLFLPIIEASYVLFIPDLLAFPPCYIILLVLYLAFNSDSFLSGLFHCSHDLNPCIRVSGGHHVLWVGVHCTSPPTEQCSCQSVTSFSEGNTITLENPPWGINQAKFKVWMSAGSLDKLHFTRGISGCSCQCKYFSCSDLVYLELREKFLIGISTLERFF